MKRKICRRVYLSGPISGVDDYMKRFKEAERQVQTLEPDSVVINPAEILSHLPGDYHRDEYMVVCYALIQLCDAMYMMDGWEPSLGCQDEKSQADFDGLEVYVGWQK